MCLTWCVNPAAVELTLLLHQNASNEDSNHRSDDQNVGVTTDCDRQVEEPHDYDEQAQPLGGGDEEIVLKPGEFGSEAQFKLLFGVFA